MTTYNPVYVNPHSKHTRADKQQAIIFSNDADAATDWLPIQSGDSVQVLCQRAHLRKTYDSTNIEVDGVFDPVVMGEAPTGQIQLEFKMGGEKDTMAAPIAAWKDSIVIYNQPVQMRGYVRLKFTCGGDNFSSEYNGPNGVETTPVGMLVRLGILK